MTLTDADVAAISRANGGLPRTFYEADIDNAIYLAGVAAGAKRMQERCAKVCEDYAAKMRGIKGAGGRDCAAAIRALGDE